MWERAFVFWVHLRSLTIIICSLCPANVIILFFFICIKFHSLWILCFLYLFICWWTPMINLSPGYCDLGSNKFRDAKVSLVCWHRCTQTSSLMFSVQFTESPKPTSTVAAIAIPTNPSSSPHPHQQLLVFVFLMTATLTRVGRDLRAVWIFISLELKVSNTYSSTDCFSLGRAVSNSLVQFHFTDQRV